MELRSSVKIEGFEHYDVTESGEIYNTKTGRRMNSWKNEQNYHRVTLISVDKLKRHFYVHRVVALTFHDCPGEGYEVHHKDRNRSNNHKLNLEWVTRAENMFYVHSREDLGEFADPIEDGEELPF